MVDNMKPRKNEEQKVNNSKYTVEYEDGVYIITNEVTKEISILDDVRI